MEHIPLSEPVQLRLHNLWVPRKKPGQNDIDPIALEAGRRLRHARKDEGLSQSDVAERLGFDRDDPEKPGLKPSTVGMWEQGRRRFGLEEAQKLSRIFPRYHPAYFMCVVTDAESRVLMAMNAGGNPSSESSPFQSNVTGFRRVRVR